MCILNLRSLNLYGGGEMRIYKWRMKNTECRTRNSRTIVLVFIVMLVLAATATATGPLYKTTRASKMSNKFLCGVINIPFSFMEIPKALNKNIKNTDYFTGIFVGLGEGVYKTSKRFSYGVVEVLTFPCPEVKTFEPLVDSPVPFKELAE